MPCLRSASQGAESDLLQDLLSRIKAALAYYMRLYSRSGSVGATSFDAHRNVVQDDQAASRIQYVLHQQAYCMHRPSILTSAMTDVFVKIVAYVGKPGARNFAHRSKKMKARASLKWAVAPRRMQNFPAGEVLRMMIIL